MNPRLTNGKIPINTGDYLRPIMLVDPPARELFDSLFTKQMPANRKDIYWRVMHERLSGKTLSEVAADIGVTKERIRQMESKVIRMLSKHWISTTASETGLPETDQPSHENH